MRRETPDQPANSSFASGRTSPEPLASAISRAIFAAALPPLERAHELAGLAPAERQQLYNIANLDAVARAEYERRVKGFSR